MRHTRISPASSSSGELPVEELALPLARLQALRQREEGWNGYDALPPDPHAIAYAEAWLRSLYQGAERWGAPWREPHVTSSAEGEVVSEWWNGPKKLTVYCTGAEASYVKVWGPDICTEMEDGDASAPAIQQQLWSWLVS
jgi:hypothetical protein